MPLRMHQPTVDPAAAAAEYNRATNAQLALRLTERRRVAFNALRIFVCLAVLGLLIAFCYETMQLDNAVGRAAEVRPTVVAQLSTVPTSSSSVAAAARAALARGADPADLADLKTPADTKNATSSPTGQKKTSAADSVLAVPELSGEVAHASASASGSSIAAPPITRGGVVSFTPSGRVVSGLHIRGRTLLRGVAVSADTPELAVKTQGGAPSFVGGTSGHPPKVIEIGVTSPTTAAAKEAEQQESDEAKRTVDTEAVDATATFEDSIFGVASLTSAPTVSDVTLLSAGAFTVLDVGENAVPGILATEIPAELGTAPTQANQEAAKLDGTGDTESPAASSHHHEVPDGAVHDSIVEDDVARAAIAAAAAAVAEDARKRKVSGDETQQHRAAHAQAVGSQGGATAVALSNENGLFVSMRQNTLAPFSVVRITDARPATDSAAQKTAATAAGEIPTGGRAVESAAVRATPIIAPHNVFATPTEYGVVVGYPCPEQISGSRNQFVSRTAGTADVVSQAPSRDQAGGSDHCCARLVVWGGQAAEEEVRYSPSNDGAVGRGFVAPSCPSSASAITSLAVEAGKSRAGVFVLTASAPFVLFEVAMSWRPQLIMAQVMQLPVAPLFDQPPKIARIDNAATALAAVKSHTAMRQAHPSAPLLATATFTTATGTIAVMTFTATMITGTSQQDAGVQRMVAALHATVHHPQIAGRSVSALDRTSTKSDRFFVSADGISPAVLPSSPNKDTYGVVGAFDGAAKTEVVVLMTDNTGRHFMVRVRLPSVSGTSHTGQSGPTSAITSAILYVPEAVFPTGFFKVPAFTFIPSLMSFAVAVAKPNEAIATFLELTWVGGWAVAGVAQGEGSGGAASDVVVGGVSSVQQGLSTGSVYVVGPHGAPVPETDAPSGSYAPVVGTAVGPSNLEVGY